MTFFFFPWAINQFLIAYERAPNHAVFYGGYETRKSGIVTARGIPQDFSLEDWQQFFRAGPRFCWRKNLIDEIDEHELYKAGYTFNNAFDYWLCLKFLSLGYDFTRIQSILSVYTQRDDSLENANKEENTFQSLKAIETFFPDSPAIQNLHTLTKRDSPEFYERYQKRWRV